MSRSPLFSIRKRNSSTRQPRLDGGDAERQPRTAEIGVRVDKDLSARAAPSRSRSEGCCPSRAARVARRRGSPSRSRASTAGRRPDHLHPEVAGSPGWRCFGPSARSRPARCTTSGDRHHRQHHRGRRQTRPRRPAARRRLDR